MSQYGMQMERMKPWIGSLPDDIATMKKVLEAPSAPREARLLVAGALSYLVTRMDLIPDWEETCGVLDDAMILRVAMALASEKDLGDLDGETLRQAARLGNEAEVIHEFLGEDLYARLKKYTEELATKAVRGRTPAKCVDDEKERGHLYADVKDELRNFPPAPMTDPEGVARMVHNYLASKLGGKAPG